MRQTVTIYFVLYNWLKPKKNDKSHSWDICNMYEINLQENHMCDADVR